MSTNADARAYALGYRKYGFSVIPIRPRDKRPLIEWTPFQSRIATPAEINAWYTNEPQAGVGIVGGAVSGDLAVLDVDPRHGGVETLQAMGAIPDTPMVKTGSGGLHYYFRGTAKSRPIAAGLDCKAEGGYVVAPPSLHPDTGQSYVWLPDASPRVLARAPMPDWLGTLSNTKQIVTPDGNKESSDRWIVDALRGVVEGQRDNACIRLAGYLRSKHLPRDIAMAIMERWARDCKPVFEPDMLVKTVNSAYKYDVPASEQKGAVPL